MMDASQTAPRASPEGSAAAQGVPLIELRGASKRFVKRLDLAARIGNRLGAHVREEIVRAVDHVDIAVFPGVVVGLVG
jgi:peptide/nickel transport system ATP-binding protein